MKKIFFLATTALIAIAWSSCSNGHIGSPAIASANTDTAARLISFEYSANEAWFSATIDGQHYSSSFISGRENVAFNQVDNKNQPYVAFFTGRVPSVDDPAITRNFRLVVEKKIQSIHATAKEEIPDYGIELLYQDSNHVLHQAENIQLHVMVLSDTRVKGSFSGQMNLIENAGNAQKKMIGVEVQFDIPIILVTAGRNI